MMTQDQKDGIDELIAIAKRNGAIEMTERVIGMLNLDTPDDIKCDDVANLCNDMLKKWNR